MRTDRKRRFALLLPLALLGLGAAHLAWEDLTESDWVYALATRFALVDGHKVHYPTPPAELAKLLEARQEAGALRHLAEARLALGDRKGALEAMEKWAAAEGAGSPAAGAEAWADTARWAAAHMDMAAAFRAAERALPGLPEGPKRELSDQRIHWADQHPDLADPVALRRAKSESFPQDAAALEDWIRALEKAGRLSEADQALAAAEALPPERRLLMRADLAADHGDAKRAFEILDGVAAEPWDRDFRQAYARRVDKAAASQPRAWRAALEARWDAGALVRLATYFQGQGRGDAAADLLRQVDRRYGAALDRKGALLMARLYGEIDAAPEAFRATLAAAHLGSAEEQASDLAALARLALRAGGRPLAWGSYNDESYRWAASVDRTPGFWTGGLSFLLTGGDWKEALDHLESESLPDRTFTTARALADELAKRAPKHPELPALRAAIMARHVGRGEGAAALALLPLVETADPAVADEGRRLALLAARQVKVDPEVEISLFKARLKHAAPDGSRPTMGGSSGYVPEEAPAEDGEGSEPRPWVRPAPAQAPGYPALLDEAVARLDSLDPSHRRSLGLILGELDRMPDAEDLWLSLAARLEGWNLDDDLGPRYEQALKRFQGEGIWARTARWYAKRDYHAQLKRLAEDIAARFRGAEIFRKADGAGDLRVEIPEQPKVGTRVRLSVWADWIRFKALERFPHSPTVFKEAGRLVTATAWQRHYAGKEGKNPTQPVVVPDALMEERRWAILFVDPEQREAWFAEAMAKGTLESKLAALEARADRTPVEDRLLFEGWARLSRFEKAVGAADRLTASYPADAALAGQALSLHRSLNGLESSHAAAARALVARAAQAVEDPAPLWTELGELEEDRGQPAAAMDVWKAIVERDPRNPARISELATLLWDYGHDAEALSVVEEGRKRLGRPRFYAFETGVLRENLHDLDGAVREYLDAVRPESAAGFISWFEQDQRSLRRLAQLLGREKAYAVVARRIRSLKPGDPEDERALAAYFPLATIEPPTPGLSWDADQWIDQMDLPADPVGREQRQKRMAAARPAQRSGIERIGDLLLEKTRDMAAQATATEFLDAMEASSRYLMGTRWSEAEVLDFQDAVMARRAKLAPYEEDRIRLEMGRASWLAEKGRGAAADAVWAALEPRIGALPEGTVKLRAEAERAAYLERAKGAAAAAQAWEKLTARYPWSLGLLEDRLAFLDRAGRGEEARALLEGVVPKAAPGHREALLERLTKDALAASDLPRAHRAVAQLLAQDGLDEGRRLGAAHLLARLSLRERADWDPMTLVKAEGPKLRPDLLADLYHEVARAADLEGAPAKAQPLWIEALNRRTDRAWLAAAGRSAEKAGKGAELLAFFEKQQARSPRDVRWAVAVRDLRTAFHQVDGALEAAKAAVAVRPEKEELWREAADLLVRADRVKEAADYLEGWAKARAADEGVAGWRSGLYARAGETEKALAVERAALAAYAREAPEEQEQLASRKARAAGRLMEYGLPELALRVYTAKGDVRELTGTAFPSDRQASLALMLNQMPRLLAQWAGDEIALQTAANVVGRQARPDQKEDVQGFLLRQIFPVSTGTYDSMALARWWPFAERAGLEPQLRTALGARLASLRTGPWQAAPSAAFAARVGQDLIAFTDGRPAFREPDLSALWVRDLARRDRGEELLAFLEPRWQGLLAQVKGAGPAGDRQSWSAWLDDREVQRTWTRALAAHPDKVAQLGEVMGERRLWDRFWGLAARGWDDTMLVGILPEAPRTAWFRFWEAGGRRDPVLAARRATVEQVAAAVGRLVRGEPRAADDPLVAKLRGPRTVGEVLGRDARWTWPEFVPRRDAKGEIAEEGEYRVVGQGADAGRLPGALWGERPGEAWYVLESLARYRQGDSSAALLPLDLPQRGAETSRTLLALRLARGLKDLPLALELEAAHPGPAQDQAWLEGRLALLSAAGQKDKAAAAFQAFVRAVQGGLDEAAYRRLAADAEDWGLVSPLELMDAERPVGPAFLAYLQDRRPEAAARFTTADEAGFRAALANRWRDRESQLTAAQVRTWLRTLWATDSAPLPRKGLAKLGPAWSRAGDWLQRRPVQDREEALDALAQALDPKVTQPRLFALLDGPGKDEAGVLLGLRVRLARNEETAALAAVDGMLAELRRGQGLSYGALTPAEGPADETGEGAEAPRPAQDEASGDGTVNRLLEWLAPFREAKKAAPVEARFRRLLQERRQEGAVSVAAWRLAFRLAPAEEVPALVQELDRAWFRGEVYAEQLGPLVDALAEAAPAEAPRWLDRWPQGFDRARALARAAVLVRLKRPEDAARTLFEARRRGSWRGSDEVAAFDAWRRMGAPVPAGAKAPAPWAAALPAWASKADAGALAAQLKAHPFDVLSARAALRSLAPADEELTERAALALNASGGDRTILQVRAVRGLLPRSPRAAASALRSAGLEGLAPTLAERRYRTADIDQALGDLVRAAARGGDAAEARPFLAALADRNPAAAKALRAELALDAVAKPETFRLVDGRPAPIRPRDLTWALLSNVLLAEGVR